MGITNGAHDPSARCAGTSPSRSPRWGGNSNYTVFKKASISAGVFNASPVISLSMRLTSPDSTLPLRLHVLHALAPAHQAGDLFHQPLLDGIGLGDLGRQHVGDQRHARRR